jgi:aminoglycoside phosphotransferase (APT) family kinase protein
VTDEALIEQLASFCRAHSGDPAAAVSDVRAMPGHAGFSYGFTLRTADGEQRLVLRLAPPGVRPEGTADIVRQARLIDALAPTEVPVPPVRWFGAEERWFGRPYAVVGHLAGRPLWQPDGPGTPSGGATAPMARAALRALVALHRLDWRERAPHLGEPLMSEPDIVRWDRFYERSAEPELVALGPEVKRRLLATQPVAPRVGIFHGDYQWGNLLFDGECLTGVLDWELANPGPALNDLGWLMVFSDPASWGPERGKLPDVPAPERLAELYAEELGEPLEHVAFYRALAGYKFSIIAGFNLMLHRRGKRPDPYYELLRSSIPRLMERALEVLDAG